MKPTRYPGIGRCPIIQAGQRIGLGAYLSASPPTNGGGSGPINAIPQVANPLGNILTDTVNWGVIVGTFVAVGGEEFITIGNFYDDSNTVLLNTTTGGPQTIPYPYYWIDNVEVVIVPTGNPSIDGDSTICLGDSTTLTYLFDTIISWVDSSDTTLVLSTVDSITVAPATTTTYIAYGVNDTVSFTVNVLPLPSVSLGNDTAICEGDSVFIGCKPSWR